MENFKEYYSRSEIIKYLCKIRVKYANKRNKKYLLNKLTTKENYLKEVACEYDHELLSQLDKLLPPRRLWLTKGQRTFKVVKNKITNKSELVKLDTDEKNREILYNTINRYYKLKSKLSFISNLENFINEIQYEIDNEIYKVKKPDIIPGIKERNKSKLNLQIRDYKAIECRPICRFSLKDRIVLSLTNKFFTKIFDEFFEESSLAFRALKDDELVMKSHHTAVRRIIDFKKSHENEILYVAECDMKKFYDTVNHKICLDSFEKLIAKVKTSQPNIELTKAIHIFKEYLSCYTFTYNVNNELNENKSYWSSQKDINGKPINGFYPWVQEEIKESEYYINNPDASIGIPQGGALSGLIANIILDYADKQLKTIEGLFYVRYCDDMILMHRDNEKCKQAIDIYINSIKELALFNHPFKNNFFDSNKNYLEIRNALPRYIEVSKTKNILRSYEYTIKPFWNSKSKGPYLWYRFDSSINSLPWIGFVGYEIKYNGNIRIRKKSLNKELYKQKKTVTSIIKRIKKNKNVRNNTIMRSAIEKLNGMSVGRITLYNYKTCSNKLCWTDGFQCLNLNKDSKIQLRSLDRNKYKFIDILRRHLGPDIKKTKFNTDNNEEIYKMEKPFSYYYQAGEKKEKSSR